MSTLSERILGAAAGEYIDRKVDRAYAHDGTGVLTLEAWKGMGGDRLGKDTGYYIQFDHIAPANNGTTATLQHEMRDFAKSSCMQFSDIGCGICHQLMAEGLILPGEIVVGADSHSVTLGAFGAFATGVGATDMAAIWLTGETWFRVPESAGIHLTGRFTGAAEAKDLALAYVVSSVLTAQRIRRSSLSATGYMPSQWTNGLSSPTSRSKPGQKPGSSMQTM